MSDNKFFPKNKREPRWKQITVFILTIIATSAFLAEGGSILFGTESAIAMFDEIGWGQWFRYLTGLVEIIGAILIFLPRTSFWGALLMSLMMIGAVLAHLFFISGSPSKALVLLLISSYLTSVKPIQK